jgi:hypothetical protein
MQPAPQQQPRQPGSMQKYLPWYGAAGLSSLGHHLGRAGGLKGQLLGTLAGTALGVHGGEALGKRLDRVKMAAMVDELEKLSGLDVDSKKRQQARLKETAKTVGESALGFGAGYLTGAGLARAAERIAEKQGKHMPTFASKLTALGVGGAAASYPLWKHYESERLKRAGERS